MATTKKKKKSSKKSSSQGKAAAAEGPKVHTDATATLLAFANPLAGDPEPIARECVSVGLETIGIHGPFEPDFLIDFGGLSRDDCIDFANAIEICVGTKGFGVPALSGPFVIMHEKGITITFANLVKAIAKMMRPK